MKIENIGDLHVLVQTVRGGTLSAAARTLGITPAAASATLKRLEAQLGTRLFERSTRAMRLTPQGQILLDYAQRAFELLAEGESQVAEDRAALVGTVRVAAPSDLTRNLLLPLFDEFMRAHPGLQLQLSVADRVLDVMRDEVDVAIRFGTLADSRLVARTLVASSPICSASPDYLRRHGTPQTPQDLLRHNSSPSTAPAADTAPGASAATASGRRCASTATAAPTTRRWRANGPWRARASC